MEHVSEMSRTEIPLDATTTVASPLAPDSENSPQESDASVLESSGVSKEGSAPKLQQITNIEEFKPQSETKTYVYSMKELMKISKVVSQSAQSGATANLPKKSFWRLTSRHPDIRQVESAGGNGNGHKNDGNSRGQDSGNEKKGHRNRNSRNGRRGSKFSKGEKPFVEEKDIKVNNDELLALEEEIKPTGNSITDFENWRAKMKELERKKKGIASKNSTGSQERPPLTNNSSSISDFFNLKRESSSNFEELEPQGTSSENMKGSHSRFSSFFNSTPPPGLSGAQSTVAKPPTPKEEDARPAAGSRILSFFDKMDSQKHAASSVEPNIQMAEQISQTKAAPVHEQTNSHFFQGLLNRGKASPGNTERNNSNREASGPSALISPNTIPTSKVAEQPKEQAARSPAGPPGLSKLPPNKHVMSSQPQPGFLTGMPPNVYSSNSQPMGAPPSGFQHFQMPLPGVAVPQQFFANPRQTGDFTGSQQKDDNSSRPSNMQIPYMPNPRGIPPPGIPPMHMMPPGISQDMPLPMNGMMPPPSFYLSQGPSFGQFNNPPMPQNGMVGQPQSQNLPPRKG
ncbi:Eap1p [Lachancea thermotolerans CBS 6340]|uniref:KLTH0C02420p n=1 Tax=Lachancea thermotolerans (strain ATCC 56472 / CBS 6340 / NRRL Y-8284) TaxID=559295 RepID=C5DDN4_LACTC|nr:KLTH0C02420p [Lachancea thermotolerans CBS 6340]CAR21895.1 KLTH0C02420p [Lachancea thermotolerans CBS 6340]